MDYYANRRLVLDEKKEAGVCTNCTRPASPGRLQCDYHRKSREMTMWLRKCEAADILGGECCECGERDVRILEFDHVNSDGYLEGNDRMSGQQLHVWCIRNPKEAAEKYQLLCANCHMRKSAEDAKINRKGNR